MAKAADDTAPADKPEDAPKADAQDAAPQAMDEPQAEPRPEDIFVQPESAHDVEVSISNVGKPHELPGQSEPFVAFSLPNCGNARMEAPVSRVDTDAGTALLPCAVEGERSRPIGATVDHVPVRVLTTRPTLFHAPVDTVTGLDDD